jgi:hypothetical protein
MNADTKLNPLCCCNVEIGAGYSELDVDGCDLGIDQACPIILEPAERPFPVQANQSAVPGNIGREDR